MPYSAKAIANYFLAKAREANRELTPMKLQKLVYFAQGWHLAVRNRPLIDEQVEAWKFGPVVRTLYREFSEFGDRPIDREATRWIKGKGIPCIEVTPSLADRPEDAEFTAKFLDRVWDIYGDYTAIQLSNLTHEPGTPWDATQRKYGGAIPLGTDIPQDEIRSYFRSLARSGATSA